MTPDFQALFDAWQAWSCTSGDRDRAVRLCHASTAVAPVLGVPAYRVTVLLADGRRRGLSDRDVVLELEASTAPEGAA